MKILHFILGRASLNTSNGVNKVIHGLCKYSCINNHEVVVFGLSKSMDSDHEIVRRDKYTIRVYKRFRLLWHAMKLELLTVDIVHLHSVWNNYNLIVAVFCFKKRIPYVITVHSGLSLDRLKQSNYYLKVFYHRFLQKIVFDRANGVHAITNEEKTSILNFIDNDNIFVTPNGLDLDFPELNNLSLSVNNGIDRSIINFCYLGRLSVEKNILGLIDAISIFKNQNQNIFVCYLIGPSDSSYKSKVTRRISKYGLEDFVILTGPKYGNEKYNLLRSMDFYIHPAFSDVVSIAVKEAMFCELPLIITRTSDVSYYYNSEAFIMTEPDPQSLAIAIEKMFSLKKQWPFIGKNAFSLVKETFNWAKIVPRMLKEYDKIVSHA